MVDPVTNSFSELLFLCGLLFWGATSFVWFFALCCRWIRLSIVESSTPPPNTSAPNILPILRIDSFWFSMIRNSSVWNDTIHLFILWFCGAQTYRFGLCARICCGWYQTFVLRRIAISHRRAALCEGSKWVCIVVSTLSNVAICSPLCTQSPLVLLGVIVSMQRLHIYTINQMNHTWRATSSFVFDFTDPSIAMAWSDRQDRYHLHELRLSLLVVDLQRVVLSVSIRIGRYRVKTICDVFRCWANISWIDVLAEILMGSVLGLVESIRIFTGIIKDVWFLGQESINLLTVCGFTCLYRYIFLRMYDYSMKQSDWYVKTKGAWSPSSELSSSSKTKRKPVFQKLLWALSWTGIVNFCSHRCLRLCLRLNKVLHFTAYMTLEILFTLSQKGRYIFISLFGILFLSGVSRDCNRLLVVRLSGLTLLWTCTGLVRVLLRVVW